MDTMLWEAYKEKGKITEALEHQRRRIDFHEHYYRRPTFILAWCREELADCLNKDGGPEHSRRWLCTQEYQRAYHMLAILCGQHHQYALLPYNKLWQLQGSSTQD